MHQWKLLCKGKFGDEFGSGRVMGLWKCGVFRSFYVPKIILTTNRVYIMMYKVLDSLAGRKTQLRIF